MLEVLLAWLLITLFLLAILQILIFSMRIVKQSFYYSLATSRLISVREILITVESGESKQNHYNQWSSENHGLLPNVSDSYSCKQTGCVVALHWRYHNTAQQLMSPVVAY